LVPAATRISKAPRGLVPAATRISKAPRGLVPARRGAMSDAPWSCFGWRRHWPFRHCWHMRGAPGRPWYLVVLMAAARAFRRRDGGRGRATAVARVPAVARRRWLRDGER